MGNSLQSEDTIPDHEDLYRNIAQGWIHKNADGVADRFSSQAFLARDNQVSVQRSSVVGPEQCFAQGGPRIIGVAAITAGGVRGLGLSVVPDPKPGLPGHAVILTRSRTDAKQIGKMARWVYPDEANPFA